MQANKTSTVVLSALCVLTCLVIASAQDVKWKTIKPGGEEFTVEMPGLPTRVGRIVPTEKDNKLAPSVYDLVVNNVRYQILSFHKIPNSPVPMLRDFNLFAEGFQRAFVEGNDRRNNSITAEKRVITGDLSAQQFQLKLDSHNGLLRLYDGTYHFYAVMIIGGVESDSLVHRFLSSFKLGKMHTPQLPDKSISDIAQPKNPPEPWSGQLPADMAPISAGILNGKAIELPAPAYPEEARQAKVSGMVKVRVLVDEQGTVVSAEAVEGLDVLRDAATKAAWRARFSQTRLWGQPVKVTGILVYGFVYGR